jgi:nitrite reductase (NO-forming)
MSDTATTTATRCRPAWPKDALRVTFGVIWGIDAGLKWLPGFRSGYADAIDSAGQGQPGWLHWWFTFWADPVHPYFWAYLVAVVETLIAAALILGFARKLTYISAGLFSLLIWATAEGFGGPYTAGSSDIGTAVIYAVVFAGLLAISYYAGTARYSVDYYLEQRYPWWWRLAELRRPAAAEKPPLVSVADISQTRLSA